MSDSQKAKLKVTFDTFDSSGDGTLSIQEVARVLKKNGSLLEDHEIAEMFLQDDKNQDSKISFEEFWENNKKRDPKTVKEEELRALFQDFDTDGSGVLTVDDIKGVLANVETDEDAAAVLSDMDQDSDGKVKFEEFLASWKAGLK